MVFYIWSLLRCCYSCILLWKGWGQSWLMSLARPPYLLPPIFVPLPFRVRRESASCLRMLSSGATYNSAEEVITGYKLSLQHLEFWAGDWFLPEPFHPLMLVATILESKTCKKYFSGNESSNSQLVNTLVSRVNHIIHTGSWSWRSIYETTFVKLVCLSKSSTVKPHANDDQRVYKPRMFLLLFYLEDSHVSVSSQLTSTGIAKF